MLKTHSSFLSQIFQTLKTLRIDVSDLELDHICYRVETWERYKELKEELISEATLLSETEVGGRPICTFRLSTPLRYEKREIWILELPAPKYGSPHTEGFEHVEFVIQESFDEFMKKYAYISFNTKAIHKEINPDIGIDYDRVRIKFHHNSLEHVVKYLQG